MAIPITSVQNERVKGVVKLRDRRERDATGRMLIEGYRETRRALDNGVRFESFFFCQPLFLGDNEPALLDAAATAGADLFDCSEAVFRKISYRDRPDGLLAVAPVPRRALADLTPPPNPLVLVMEHVEKPGNLGTMLRSADAGGVNATIVCDRCTDVYNPNAVRASIGAIFTTPVVEASSDEALAWLRGRGIRILAATPSAEKLHSDCDLTGPVALAVGSEQYGLSTRWMNEADERVRIPMLGQCDSLNVSAAATILIFEAVRQRLAARR